MERQARIVVVLGAGLLCVASAVPRSVAGPFTVSGNSTVDASESTYRRSIKPSVDATLDFSKKSAEVTATTTLNTYKYVTRPAAEASTKASDYSTPLTRDTLQTSSQATANTEDLTTTVTGETGKGLEKAAEFSYQKVSKPSGEYTTKASRYSSELSTQATKQTTRGSQYSSVPTTRTRGHMRTSKDHKVRGRIS